MGTEPSERAEEIATLHELVWSLEAVAARGGDLAKQAASEIGRHEKRLRKLEASSSPKEQRAPAPIAWDPSFLESTKKSRRRLAALELQLATIAARDIRAADRSERLAPANRLIAASRAAVRWGAKPEPFPGLD